MAKRFGYLTEDDVKSLKRFLEQLKQQPPKTTDRPSERNVEFYAPEVYIAKTPLAGIPGLSGDEGDTGTWLGDDYNPGFAKCYVYHIRNVGGVPRIKAIPHAYKIVYNLGPNRLAGERWIRVIKDKYGKWLADFSIDADCDSIYVNETDVRCDSGELNIYERKVYLSIIGGCLTKSPGDWQFVRFLGDCVDTETRWYCMRPPEGGTGTGTGTIMGTGTAVGTGSDVWAYPAHWYRFNGDALDSGLSSAFVHGVMSIRGGGNYTSWELGYGGGPSLQYSNPGGVFLHLGVGGPTTIRYGQADGSDNFDTLFNSGSVTVCSWVMLSNPPSGASILNGTGLVGTTPRASINLFVGSYPTNSDYTGPAVGPNKLKFVSKPGTSSELEFQSTNDIAELAPSWCHVAITYDGDHLKMYINGDLDSIHSLSVNDYLGAQYKTEGNYVWLDELMIFDRVLSAEVIASLATGRHP